MGLTPVSWDSVVFLNGPGGFGRIGPSGAVSGLGTSGIAPLGDVDRVRRAFCDSPIRQANGLPGPSFLIDLEVLSRILPHGFAFRIRTLNYLCFFRVHAMDYIEGWGYKVLAQIDVLAASFTDDIPSLRHGADTFITLNQ
jgi:hypothetical protein